MAIIKFYQIKSKMYLTSGNEFDIIKQTITFVIKSPFDAQLGEVEVGSTTMIQKALDKKDDDNKEFLARFAVQRCIENLKAQVELIDFMHNGYIPKLPETKKAAQEAVKELCAAICKFVEIN